MPQTLESCCQSRQCWVYHIHALTCSFLCSTSFKKRSYLLIKVGQPIHAFQLVTFQFTIKNGRLWNVLSSPDRWICKAVAFSKSSARFVSSPKSCCPALFSIFIKWPGLNTKRGEMIMAIILNTVTRESAPLEMISKQIHRRSGCKSPNLKANWFEYDFYFVN